MKNNDYHWSEALNLAQKLDESKTISGIFISEISKAMRILANTGDEKTFKIIVDNFTKKIDDLKIKEDPYNFLESICEKIDNDFITTSYFMDSLEIKSTQKFFQKLYKKYYKKN